MKKSQREVNVLAYSRAGGEIITCKHCHRRFDKARLLGFSLICPLCNKPQNGGLHRVGLVAKK